ncbi:MAG TPA: hypothetical protein VME63_07105 [Dyella sp.]|uniref:hypothetical protein n=1 Tax=Dyella sp. TaxID=1869338 RepID=UPI002B8078CF|nr:hypothetical protein [Dyella sp.]HTV85155.1 hypothetical protein [Dyella sp.]
MNLSKFLKRVKAVLPRLAAKTTEQQMLALGKLLADMVRAKAEIKSFEEVEFKVFSQWGDDGIIQWLINHLHFPSKTFIEFGVSNYRESNTRFLMMNNNWSGFVMDGSRSNIDQIINSEYFWRYELTAKAAFIDRENINELLRSSELPEAIGILHIDLDGNDYWIWKEITAVKPLLVILEYNSIFGAEMAITIPYDRHFQRTKAHSSNLYFGASLKALCDLSNEKGYAFIGCNTAGNNAYFVKRDALNSTVREMALPDGYVLSKFRESRDNEGNLNYINGNDRLKAIAGMPIYDTIAEKIEYL